MTQRLDYSRVTPNAAQEFLDRALPILADDPRLIGVVASGSYAQGQMDKYPDLDLMLIGRAGDISEMLTRLPVLAEEIGLLLTSFSGSMFGVPHLLVCLYAPQPLHVDLKVAALESMQSGIERPVLLFDRTGEINETLKAMTVTWPNLSGQWFEDRFWVWVDYVARKIGRGELFDAIDCIAMIRKRALGPMIARSVGRRQDEVRHLERIAPGLAMRLDAVIARHDVDDCLRALYAGISLYNELRLDAPPEMSRIGAESAALKVLEQLKHVRPGT
jgi:hypothetical protein